jgi:hypothetical protein
MPMHREMPETGRRRATPVLLIDPSRHDDAPGETPGASVIADATKRTPERI